ncbi:hypothetical protein EV426DRAFT_206024 [Tirmania nivea]|nr:hypothetical protein EV426DRAFT_206024 [Tirmania nivea]
MDGNDVQLLVGASAPPPGIFAPVESGSATKRSIQEILESIKPPIDPATLEAMINEAILNHTMATEDLNTLITALESAENQLVFPTEETTPILVSPEPSQNQVQQETTLTSQQEVRAAPKVQDVQGVQENQRIQAEEVIQAAQGQEMDDNHTVPALRQLPETGLSSQNGTITLGILLRQAHLEAAVMLMLLGPHRWHVPRNN